ncbi:MAG: PilZ domain-containing protein, partial [Algicola sp.]|nr:PilZ domain-containing protein [Algicola sp.]
MDQLPGHFGADLLEKLIPWVNQPVGEHAITALTGGMDSASKLQLKQTLRDYWLRCDQAIDHRATMAKIGKPVITQDFANLTHYLAASALSEFKRLQKLYNNEFTWGLKHSIDAFVQMPVDPLTDPFVDTPAAPDQLKSPQQTQYETKQQSLANGWRIGASKVSDFRRRNGERLLLVSKMAVHYRGHRFEAKTANISSGGCLVLIDKTSLPSGLFDDQDNAQAPQACNAGEVGIEYLELSEQYSLNAQLMAYQVVNFKDSVHLCQLALKRVDKDGRVEFDQLIAHLMNEHRRRNRLDVENTVKALTARCWHLATIAQLNALVVLSHKLNRYHLLITQSQSFNLQTQIQLHQHLLAYMTENTGVGQCKLFLAWTDAQNTLFIAELAQLTSGKLAAVLVHWRKGLWHKAFLVKSDSLDPQLADLGTSLPCDVAPIVSKLNSPLPVNVAQLSVELAKISLIEAVDYMIDALDVRLPEGDHNALSLVPFRLTGRGGQLRQVPFSAKEDAQGNKLDSALRNLVLSNLPKVAIFANVRKQAISPSGLTGHQYLPALFIDDNHRVKLDVLFSQDILSKLGAKAGSKVGAKVGDKNGQQN